MDRRRETVIIWGNKPDGRDLDGASDHTLDATGKDLDYAALALIRPWPRAIAAIARATRTHRELDLHAIPMARITEARRRNEDIFERGILGEEKAIPIRVSL